METKKLFGCDFEVSGKVQGVFFRKYTQKQAKELGVRGWCMNTNSGTVKGQIEGSEKQLIDMKFWLRNEGSPKSAIKTAQFGEMKQIPHYTFDSFAIHQ